MASASAEETRRDFSAREGFRMVVVVSREGEDFSRGVDLIVEGLMPRDTQSCSIKLVMRSPNSIARGILKLWGGAGFVVVK